MTPEVAPPPERFNFAEHLLALNANRAGKPAFVDEQGTVTYGELAERTRRMASALKSLFLRREERVLVLMHDGCDWPVAFLGARLTQHIVVVLGREQRGDGRRLPAGVLRAQDCARRVPAVRPDHRPP